MCLPIKLKQLNQIQAAAAGCWLLLLLLLRLLVPHHQALPALVAAATSW
jgi:hypothetical protein